ncbi:hypothetical protein [Hymenobacter elongatus]|uniref:Uncharacterized protein n=1 Tax=Hymenobacter elongatus TaxID=877208 RepID=A0A4Z0PNT7_9BACT|nr:hypothetical protein [Hymenobacter elongatus]TGE18039.1 hypothetical protein E5J99_05740 [Hymenobacter elongatus]
MPKPPWTYDQAIGWTIYPPLSALPQAIPASVGPTTQEHYTYTGLLWGAGIASVVALVCWLSGLLSLVFRPNQEKAASRLKIVVPLLLVPCAIHLTGMATQWKEPQQQSEVLEEYLLEKETGGPDEILESGSSAQMREDSLTNPME